MESGYACLTLHPRTRLPHALNYCRPPKIVVPGFEPIPVPFSDILKHNWTPGFAPNFFGAQRKLYLEFENQVLTGIAIEFGSYNKTLLEAILGAVNERYGRHIGPTPAEIEDFNREKRSCIAFTSANNSVMIFVYGGLRRPLLQLRYGLLKSDCLPGGVSSAPGSKL